MRFICSGTERRMKIGVGNKIKIERKAQMEFDWKHLRLQRRQG